MRLLFLFILSLWQLAAYSKSAFVDSIGRQAAAETNDSLRALLFIKSASQTIDSNLTMSRKLAVKAYEVANEHRLPTLTVEAENILGNICQRQAKPDSAMFYYQAALKICERVGYTAGLAKILNNIAIIHTYSAEYEQAIALYFDAIKAEEAMKNPVGVSQAYNNIAVVYYQMKNLDKTIEYLKKAGDILDEINDDATLKKIYINIGAIHSYREENEEALTYYQKAFEISERLGDKREMAICLGNMADVYTETGAFEKAENCINQAIAIKQQDHNEAGIMHEYGHMARLYAHRRQFEKAQEYYQKAMEIGNKNKLKAELRDLYKVYSQSLNDWGHFDEAYEMLAMSYMYNDSLVNELNAKAVAEMETKYQTEKKEKTILAQDKKLTMAALQLSIRNRWILVLTLGSVIIILIALFFVQRNKRLAQAEKDAAIIKEREEGIEAIFRATENERRRIAADLHDGVGQQLSGLKLAFSNLSTGLLDRLPQEAGKIEKLAEVIDQACVDVRNLSHEMMPKALSESGLVPAIDDMLNKTLGLTEISYEFDHHGVNGRFNENIELALFRICQELINNVVKHSGAQMVSVQLYKTNNYLVLLVEDNGKGIGQSSSDGIGLKNMQSRVNTLHGELNLEPSPNAGTVATVRVPL
ncbi:tetratricopeptide repeat protein [bacterium]|nr:tetratricopeptide repeat protein [bacterium]